MVNKSFIFVFLILQLLLSSNTNAQSNKIPPFRIVQPGGTVFKAEDLPLDKPVIIIYFSTECEDCQQLTDNLLGKINEFKSSSIVMITYFPPDNVSKFADKNNLNRYSNIFIGTEGNSLFILNYYNIRKFPFIALYSKTGDLIKKYYDLTIDLDDVLLHLKNLVNPPYKTVLK